MTRRIRHSRNSGGSLWLLPLPLGLGLNIGRGFGSCSPSVRSWEWARYDFADHEPLGSERWADVQLAKSPEAATPFAKAWDTWQTARFNQRLGKWKG